MPIAPRPAADPDTLLATARRSLDWVRASASDTPAGRRWAYQPDQPDAVSPLGGPDTFYSGTAGVVAGLLEVHDATGEPEYLADARAGAAQVVADLQDPTAESGLYLGVAGQAWTLAQVAQASGDDALAGAARRATDLVAERLVRTGDRGTWTEQPGILFDAGAMLHLVWAADHFGEEGWLEPASAFGRHLLDLAQPDERGGWAWLGMSRVPHGITEGLWPNFFYGTSGIGFALARLAAATGEQQFLDAAQRAAANIRAIADHVVQDGTDGVLVPYREPDLRDLHYIGLCQGPVGTARLFRQLHEVTGDPADADWVDLLGNGLVASGAPAQHSPGYWNVHGACCGGAGMAAFHLARWADTGDDVHLERAEDAARYLAGEALDLDGRGPRWITAFNRVDPLTVRASSDWGHGASGIAAVLAQVWAARQGRFSARRLPDDPFPPHRSETTDTTGTTTIHTTEGA